MTHILLSILLYILLYVLLYILRYGGWAVSRCESTALRIASPDPPITRSCLSTVVYVGDGAVPRPSPTSPISGSPAVYCSALRSPWRGSPS